MLIDPGLVVFGLLFMALLHFSRVIPRGMPVLFLLVLPVMIIVEYVPVVQMALTTETPLVLKGLFHESFAIDGLSLLFALLISSVAAITALYAVLSLDEAVYNRFIRGMLIITSALLAFVMVNKADILVYLLVGMGVGAVWMIYFNSRDHLEATGQKWQSWILACVYVMPLLIMRVGISLLEDSGTAARQLTETLVEINQLSTANLSQSRDYALFFGCFLAALLASGLSSIFLWQRAKSTSALSRLFLPCMILTTTLYPLARFYPALHDNPLWWTVVTGAGLLVMLIGAVWTLRQSNMNRLLIALTFSVFGACLALLGLPEYLGVQAALMGIGVYGLALAGLFLGAGVTGRWAAAAVGVAMLAMAIVDLKTIDAFTRLSLPWAGFALAAVVLSTALLTTYVLRILGDVGAWRAAPVSAPVEKALAWHAMPLQIIPVILGIAALIFALTFNALWIPLLPKLVPHQGADMDISAVGLSLLAWAGGVILYLTRGAWGAFRSVAQSNDIPFTIKTPES